MGLLPEIDRAYITVDNRLYFWNYRNGSDFTSFEDLTQTIISVCLVKPKPDTFVENITHLLVLATPTDVYLLAVSYDPKVGELLLFDTSMVVSVKGLGVAEIVGSSKTGRIFFSADNDGLNLWELQYSNVETWFRSRATKVCHTNQSIIGSLVPSISIPYISDEKSMIRGVFNKVVGTSNKNKDIIIFMAVDDSRGLIYTLDNDSCIRTYYMSKDGSLKFSCKLTQKDLVSGILVAFSSYPVAERPTRDDFKSLRLVSLHVIDTVESTTINLVAFSTHGHRIYLRGGGSSFSFGVDNPPPSVLQVASIRFPPVFDTPAGQINTSKALFATRPVSRIFAPGHFFCVTLDQTTDKEIDRLFVASPDSGQVINQLSSNYNAQPRPREFGSYVDIQGSVQAIELMTKPFSANNKPEGFANECAAQYTVPPIQVAVLTNTGVYIFTRRWPFETLKGLIPDTENVFGGLYGRAETCSAALAVSVMNTVPYDIREEAAKIFVEYARKAHVIDDETTNTGEPTAVRLSSRFEGLATYLTRLVRLIWKQPLFKSVKIVSEVDPSQSQTEFKFNIEKSALESIQVRLLEIEEFLGRYGVLIEGLNLMSDSLSYMSSLPKSEEIALQGEHRGLNSLEALITSMKQGISFVQLLFEETATETTSIESILSYLNEETRNKIADLDYKSFFTTQYGVDLTKEIVTGLVNKNINKNISIDSIARSLQERCQRYCTGSDVLIYKALESLRKAKLLALTDPEGKVRAIYESVRLFQRASKNFSFESLQEAIGELISLQGYSGAIEVALSVAGNLDRGNLALGYLHDGKAPGDAREEFYRRRLQIYQLIFDVLDKVDRQVEYQENKNSGKVDGDEPVSHGHLPQEAEDLSRLRDHAYSVCFSSEDELFHYSFYGWYLSKGLEDRLLEMDTKYIRSFLITNAKNNMKIADLLWVYYQKNQEFYSSAEVLYGLAKSDYEIALSDRIEYLSRAKGYCNCDAPPHLRHPMSVLGSNVEDLLEIASIQDDILRAIRQDGRFSDEKRREAIAMLDGRVLEVSDLFNKFADPLGYYELCLRIFLATDYRGTDEITNCWQKLIHSTYSKTDTTNDEPFEQISNVVQKLGRQLQLSELVFPVDILIPYLETFNVETIKESPRGWIVDTFINAGVPCESIYSILNDMILRKEYPFSEQKNYVRLANEIVYLLERWSLGSLRGHSLSQFIPVEELNKLCSIVGQRDFRVVARRL